MASKRILIVDDEPAIVDVLRTRLTASGYEVCSARDGVEALEKVKNEKPDLIIMGVLMPRMTGFEAMKKIREIRKFHGIPALVISAKAGVREYFTNITGVVFVPKPYEAKELLNRVEALIGDRGAARGGLKSVILVGVEDFLVEKIRTFLSSLHYQVMTALNEEDAFNLATNLHPDFILCQFCEEETVLDVKKLSDKLAEHAALVHLPLYVYCNEILSFDAVRMFKEDRLVTYRDSIDLLKKLGPLFPKVSSR